LLGRTIPIILEVIGVPAFNYRRHAEACATPFAGSKLVILHLFSLI
jgi:hypothetical protein